MNTEKIRDELFEEMRIPAYMATNNLIKDMIDLAIAKGIEAGKKEKTQEIFREIEKYLNNCLNQKGFTKELTFEETKTLDTVLSDIKKLKQKFTGDGK